MTVESEKNKLPESKPESGAENTTQKAKQDIVATLSDGQIEKMKKKYGDKQGTFFKAARELEQYKNLTEPQMIDKIAKEDPKLKEYYMKYIYKKPESPQPLATDKTPRKLSDQEQRNLNPSEEINPNKDGEEFSQKEFERIQKEKGQDAATAYAAKWGPSKVGKKPEEKAPEKKSETPKEEKKEEKRPEEKIPEKKVDAPKTDNKPAEKPAEPKKEPEKKSEEKKEKKKHFRSARFSKKEKKEEKENKSGFFGKVGSGIAKGATFGWHQTGNFFKYPFRTVGSTIAFGWNYMDHGFSKVWREKNQGAYFSKFKWEQAAKKKQ